MTDLSHSSMVLGVPGCHCPDVSPIGMCDDVQGVNMMNVNGKGGHSPEETSGNGLSPLMEFGGKEPQKAQQRRFPSTPSKDLQVSMDDTQVHSN